MWQERNGFWFRSASGFGLADKQFAERMAKRKERDRRN